MALPPAVIKTFTGVISTNLGKISEPLAKTVIAIAVEYGPRAQAEAQIKRAVAKVAPYAVAVVSSALAFAIAAVGMKTHIRGGVRLGSFELVLEGAGASSSKRKRSRRPVRRKSDRIGPKDTKPRPLLPR